MSIRAAQILEWHGVHLAFGLEWTYSPRPMTSVEVRKRGQSLGASRYMTHTAPDSGTDSVTGFARIPRSCRADAKLVAVASMLARMHSDSAAYLLRVKDAVWALVVTLQGRPAPGLDLCGSEGEVLGVLVRELDVHGIRMVCAEPGISSLGEVLPEGVERRQLDLPTLPQAWETSSLQPLPPMPALQRSLLLAVPAAIVGLGAWQWHEQAQAARDEEAARVSADPARMRAEKVRMALSDRPRVPIGVAVPQVLEAAASQPLEVRGWSLREMNCRFVAAGVSRCELSWSGNGTSTFLDFRDATGLGMAEMVPSSDLKSITTRLELKPSLQTVELAHLPPYAEFMVNVGSQFQLLRQFGLEGTLGTPSSLGGEASAGTSGGTPGGRVLKVGAWTISGPLEKLSLVLSTWPQGFAVSTMSISFPATGDAWASSSVAAVGAGPSVRIGGDFYVH